MDITSAVFDPGLGCTAFTVERITYTHTTAKPALLHEEAGSLGGNSRSTACSGCCCLSCMHT